MHEKVIEIADMSVSLGAVKMLASHKQKSNRPTGNPLSKKHGTNLNTMLPQVTVQAHIVTNDVIKRSINSFKEYEQVIQRKNILPRNFTRVN